MVTGFRLAYGGAQEYYGVTPDLAAVGKIMGGGYALAAVCGREEIMTPLRLYPGRRKSDHVGQIGTLNGNPVACAAGLATLAELRKEGAYERIWAVGRKLREALETACAQAEIPAQTTGEDPVFDIVFTNDPLSDYRSTLSADNAIKARFRNLIQEQGIFQGPQKFYPSLAHTDEDVAQTIEAFQTVIPTLHP